VQRAAGIVGGASLREGSEARPLGRAWALREASQSLLHILQRNLNIGGDEARLPATLQIAQQATVERAQFLFVHANQFSGGDKQRHDFSPSL
jgi:hypothetical protein